jgi:hypothetical protein
MTQIEALPSIADRLIQPVLGYVFIWLFVKLV